MATTVCILQSPDCSETSTSVTVFQTPHPSPSHLVLLYYLSCHRENHKSSQFSFWNIHCGKEILYMTSQFKVFFVIRIAITLVWSIPADRGRGGEEVEKCRRESLLFWPNMYFEVAMLENGVLEMESEVFQALTISFPYPAT